MPSRRTSNWHYVYTLLSQRDGEFYLGYTRNLALRLRRHSAGGSFATAPRRPLLLIYAEACLDREDALRRERYLKTTQGRRFLKLRLRRYLTSLRAE